jgi:hypothetical protein
VGPTAKEVESSTRRVWATGFHRVTAHSRLACLETYEPCISLIFQFFFRAAVKSGYRISEYGGTAVQSTLITNIIIAVITSLKVRAARLFLFASFLHRLGGHRPTGHLPFARHLPTQNDVHTSVFGVGS